ncbi:MAG: hypothetical protein IPG64_27880 [Haliea sp.]|nr:hypothetical protein [Haliea sp.]
MHDETNVMVGVHADTPNLTKVSNGVDGQQRIISIGLLACTFSEAIDKHGCKSEDIPLHLDPSSIHWLKSCDNEQADLRELFSVEIKSTEPSRD